MRSRPLLGFTIALPCAAVLLMVRPAVAAAPVESPESTDDAPKAEPPAAAPITLDPPRAERPLAEEAADEPPTTELDPSPDTPPTKTEVQGDTDMGEDMGMDMELEGLLAQTVVAGASRSAESSAEAPAVTSSVSGTELQRYGLRSVEEAIAYLMGGLLVEPGGGQVGGRGVQFAGDRGSHVLLLLDGHFINETGAGRADFGDLAGIPLELIDRIEVVYGPGSVLYGSNAMLGVVNVVTRRGKDMDGFSVLGDVSLAPNQDEDGVIEGGGHDAIGQRYRLGVNYGKAFEIGKRPSALTFQVEYIDDKGQELQMGPQYNPVLYSAQSFGPNTEFNSPYQGVWVGRSRVRAFGPNAYAKVDVGKFTLSARSTFRRLTNQGTDFDDQKNSYMDQSSNFVDAKYRFTASERVSGVARIYGDHFLARSSIRNHNPASCPSDVHPCVRTDDFESASAGAELQFTFDWTKNGRFATMLGADARLRYAAARSNLTDPVFGTQFGTVGIIDRVDQGVAGYIQQLFKLTPRIRFNVGARIDWIGKNFAGSPRAAAIFDPWKGGTLKLIYSQAFRAPTALETLLEVPGQRLKNESLQPEKVRSGELVLEQRHGPHTVSAAGFATFWDQMISLTVEVGANGALLEKYRNLDSIQNFGGNLGYKFLRGKTEFGLNATYAFSRSVLSLPDEISAEELAKIGYTPEAITEHGRQQPLPLSPSVAGNAHVSHHLGDGLPTLALSGTLVGPRLMNGAYSDPVLLRELEQGKTVAAPAVFRGRAAISGAIARVEGLSYRVALDVASNTQGAYLVGPIGARRTGATPMDAAPEYSSIPRLTLVGGLRFRF